MAALFAAPQIQFVLATVHRMRSRPQRRYDTSWAVVFGAQIPNDSLDDVVQRLERIPFKWIQRVRRFGRTGELVSPNRLTNPVRIFVTCSRWLSSTHTKTPPGPVEPADDTIGKSEIEVRHRTIELTASRFRSHVHQSYCWLL